MVIGVALLLVQDWSTPMWTFSVQALSVASMMLGGWVFWHHGGHRITATATYSFAFALFAGFAGWFTLQTSPPGRIIPSLLPALASAYFSQVITYSFWWYDDRDIVAQGNERKVASLAVTRWGLKVGALTAAVGLALIFAGSQGPVPSEIAFVGAVLMSTAMFLRPGPGFGWIRIIIALGVLAFFALFVYTGFGRLQLGAFGLAMAFTAVSRFPGRAVKAGILLCTAPTMVYFAQQRVAFTGGLNPDQDANVTGFESVVSPLNDLGTLMGLSDAGQLGWHGLSPFFASAVALVPRAVWPGKPVGLGAELGDLLRPELTGTGYSALALFHGEWVYAFGLLGLVLMIPVVGWALRRLDQALVPIWSDQVKSRQDLIRLTLLTILIASLPDLFWGGTFLYASRAGLRVLVLAVLLSSRFHGEVV